MTSPPTTSATATPDGGRLVWPDLAKGASILLVVLHHVIVKDYDLFVSGVLTPVADLWHALTYALKPVRMPLFFAVSGFFAAAAVTRSWGSSWRRIVAGYYLYVVWLGVYIVLYSLERDIPANRVVSVADFFGELLWAASSLWFLYALAVYFVVAKALARLPPAAVVGAAAALSMSASWFGIEENNRFAVLVHLVYFLVGAYYPQALRRVADLRLRHAALLGLALLYVGAAVVVFHSGLPWSLTTLGASMVGIPLGIVLAVRLVGTRVGSGLAWVGRRTLQVYVLHLVVLVALIQLPVAVEGRGVGSILVVLLYPIAMTAAVTAACFALHRVLVTVGLGWLFALPVALDQRLGATGASAADAPTGQPATDAGARVPSDARSGISVYERCRGLSIAATGCRRGGRIRSRRARARRPAAAARRTDLAGTS